MNPNLPTRLESGTSRVIALALLVLVILVLVTGCTGTARVAAGPAARGRLRRSPAPFVTPRANPSPDLLP